MRSLLLALCLLISSCSTIAGMAKDAVMGGKGPSLEVKTDLINGDKAETVEVRWGDNSKQDAESIVNQTINDIGLDILIALVLGWILPSPSVMYSELKKGFSWIGRLGRRRV